MQKHQAIMTNRSTTALSRLLLFALSVSLMVGAVFSFVARSGHSQEREPDWILHHEKVVTVDANFSIAEAMAIANDRFTAIGTNDAILKLAGKHTKTLNLQGRTVIPDFVRQIS
jgi:hypothetical protein